MEKIYNENNVYILGAGFSAAAGMPLIADFMRRMRESVDWLTTENLTAQLQALDEVFAFRKEASSAAYRVNMDIDDIEQLFSLASASDRPTLDVAIKESIATTLEFCHEKYRNENTASVPIAEQYISRVPTARIKNGYDQSGVDYKNCDLNQYPYYTGLLLGRFDPIDKTPYNSFITFNYDLVLEEALQHLSLQYHYGVDNPEIASDAMATEAQGVPVLKLHGSANWGYTESNKRVTIFKDYKAARLSPVERLIIPPTWQKSFRGPFESIWKRSVLALSTATRIIVIGFSVPATDTHFKYLMAAGLKENISLREIVFVNSAKEPEFKEKLSNLFTPVQISKAVVRHEPKSLENFLNSYKVANSFGRPCGMFH